MDSVCGLHPVTKRSETRMTADFFDFFYFESRVLLRQVCALRHGQCLLTASSNKKV